MKKKISAVLKENDAVCWTILLVFCISWVLLLSLLLYSDNLCVEGTMIAGKMLEVPNTKPALYLVHEYEDRDKVIFATTLKKLPITVHITGDVVKVPLDSATHTMIPSDVNYTVDSTDAVYCNGKIVGDKSNYNIKLLPVVLSFQHGFVVYSTIVCIFSGVVALLLLVFGVLGWNFKKCVNEDEEDYDAEDYYSSVCFNKDDIDNFKDADFVDSSKK